MACQITNLAKQLLIIRLNSGKAVYLAPHERSCQVGDSEIVDNQKVDKLLKRQMIRIERVGPQAAATSAAPAGERGTPEEESGQGAEEAAATTAPIPEADEGEESRRNLSTNKKK